MQVLYSEILLLFSFVFCLELCLYMYITIPGISPCDIKRMWVEWKQNIWEKKKNNTKLQILLLTTIIITTTVTTTKKKMYLRMQKVEGFL